jgi:hypothetical protein
MKNLNSPKLLVHLQLGADGSKESPLERFIQFHESDCTELPEADKAEGHKYENYVDCSTVQSAKDAYDELYNDLPLYQGCESWVIETRVENPFPELYTSYGKILHFFEVVVGDPDLLTSYDVFTVSVLKNRERGA